MIDAPDLISRLHAGGVSVVAGVPCSYLTPVINRAIGAPEVRYLPVSQEGEAVAVAAGAWLGGGLGCAISQNSGLGNMVNPLSSLLHTARIPAVLLVTWRGRPGEPDEPQHELMGRHTLDLLDVLEVPWSLLPDDARALPEAVAAGWDQLGRDLPYAFVVPKGAVAPEALSETPPAAPPGQLERPGEAGGPAPTRTAALEEILARLPDHAVVVSTTGKTSRELYELDDRAQHFYLVGAMGSAATVGLGLALHTPRPVVVIDGDGALLMRLGSLATVAAQAPSNLVHIVLDNGVHDSTGGQATLSGVADLPAVAAACGYARAVSCGSADDLGARLARAVAEPGPTLLHLRIRAGSPAALGRPGITPIEVARRFRDFVASPLPGVPAPRPLEVRS